jgi:FkbM family methyltransferase
MEARVRWFLDKLPNSIQALVRKLWHKVNVVIMPRRKLATFATAQYYRALLQDKNIDCVIDVGANEGQFADFLRDDVGYEGQIVSFEPVSRTFEKLRLKASNDPHWDAIRVALGEKSGTATINIAASAVFSSFLPVTSDDLYHSLSRPVAEEQVSVERLDSFSDRFGRFKHLLLKTDTQGFDLAVLRGAQGLLDRIEGIQVELSFIPIYDGMPVWRDVLQELEARGYALSNMFPIAMHHLNTVEFDCIVVKKSSASAGDHYLYDDLLLRRRSKRLPLPA